MREDEGSAQDLKEEEDGNEEEEEKMEVEKKGEYETNEADDQIDY